MICWHSEGHCHLIYDTFLNFIFSVLKILFFKKYALHAWDQF